MIGDTVGKRRVDNGSFDSRCPVFIAGEPIEGFEPFQIGLKTSAPAVNSNTPSAEREIVKAMTPPIEPRGAKKFRRRKKIEELTQAFQFYHVHSSTLR